MIVVSNTSPIFYLSTIGQLDLLRQLYAEIVIPTAVFNEITHVGNTDASARVVPTLSWIKTQSATDQEFVNTLRAELDPGEAEAIALAVELNADRLLMDERLGRAAAMRVGLQVTGVLGILIAAKRNNLIQEVKPLLDALIEQVGFWIDARFYAEVLQAVGESA
jgi:predicted nucleic acid-binding protein